MSTLIQPAVALMNRLKYPQKFLLISVLFALPLAVVMSVLIAQFDDRINFARSELDGAAYLRPLRGLIEHVPQQRALAHVYLAGDTSVEAALLSKQAQIGEDFKALEAVDQRLGPSLGTAERAGALLRDWQVLHSELLARDVGASDDLHTKLIADIRALISHVGDTSKLILDPDLDAYYAMDAVLLKLPEGQDLLAQIALLGDSAIRRGSLLPQEKGRLTVLSGLARSNSAALEGGLETGFRNNPAGNLRPALEAALRGSASVTDAYLRTIDDALLNTGPITIRPEQHSEPAAKARDASFALWDRTIVELERLLQARIDGVVRQKYAISLFALLIFVVIFYLLAGFYRSVMRTVASLERAAKGLASGATVEMVTLDNRDELGQVARSFNTIATALIQAGAERQAAEEARARLQDEIIRTQAATLADLSTPLIPISDQIVALPLIGAVDAQRIRRVQEALLRGIAGSRARVAILDITGVPAVDMEIAEGILQAARGVRLLGAEIVLTGIRSDVAQILVGLGIDLQTIETRSTLQSGIAFALARGSSFYSPRQEPAA